MIYISIFTVIGIWLVPLFILGVQWFLQRKQNQYNRPRIKTLGSFYIDKEYSSINSQSFIQKIIIEYQKHQDYLGYFTSDIKNMSVIGTMGQLCHQSNTPIPKMYNQLGRYVYVLLEKKVVGFSIRYVRADNLPKQLAPINFKHNKKGFFKKRKGTQTLNDLGADIEQQAGPLMAQNVSNYQELEQILKFTLGKNGFQEIMKKYNEKIKEKENENKSD